MAKKNTLLVKLTSTAVKENGKPTGTYFVKKRNPKKQTTKLEFTKYDPVVRKHVLFVEKKMPSHSK